MGEQDRFFEEKGSGVLNPTPNYPVAITAQDHFGTGVDSDVWTTPSKKPLSHHNDALHHNQIESKTTMVMVFHQNHVARSFIKKSAPRPRILGFTLV